MSYDNMREYLDLLRDKSSIFETGIDWNIIKTDQITTFTHGKRMGLQIADAVAGSFFFAVEPNRFGFAEARYVNMLKPVIYNEKGRYLGYGFKFWPKEAITLLKNDKNLSWFKDEFQ